MNYADRALNRAFVLLIGLLAVGLGSVAVALVTMPDFLRGWARTAPSVLHRLSEMLAATVVADTGRSWIPVVGLAAAVLLVVALAAFIVGQALGHRGRLIAAGPAGKSSPTVDPAVAEVVLTDALRGHAEFASIAVSAQGRNGTPVLEVSAAVRHGVAQGDAITLIERAVHRLDTLLGAEVPILVQLKQN